MRKSFVLIFVTSLLLLCLVIFSFYFFAMRSHIERVEGNIDRTRAYYICESALAAAMQFYSTTPFSQREQWNKGTVLIPTPYSKRSHDGFILERENFTVNYEITEPGGGVIKIHVWVDSPQDFKNRQYHLTATSQRTVPIFLRGFPNK